MSSDIGFLNSIRKVRSTLSKSHKKLADYIIDNYEQAVFLTASQLGQKVGVSESTVVRFAYRLGLSGFPEMQSRLADTIKDKIHTYERIDINNGGMPQEQVLDNVLKADADKIKRTLESIDRQAFNMAVEDIMTADNVYVVGVRSCAPLATFLTYYLKMIRSNVILVDCSNTNELFEQLIHIGAGDVIVGISFPRYSMRTLKAMEFANQRNAKVIAITDSKHSPMNMYSSCNLFAKSDMALVVDSLVAPLSIINAIIVALCLRCNEQVIGNLEMLDKVMSDYSYDANDEINLIDENVLYELKKMSGDGLW